MAEIITSANKLLGNKFKLYLVEGSTNTAVPTENSLSLSITNNTIDSSDKRISWQQFIDGVKGWSSSVEFHYTEVTTDPGYMLVQKLLAGDTRTPVVIGRPNDANGVAFKGYVRISQIDITANQNELMTCSMSLTGDAELEVIQGVSAFSAPAQTTLAIPETTEE